MSNLLVSQIRDKNEGVVCVPDFTAHVKYQDVKWRVKEEGVTVFCPEKVEKAWNWTWTGLQAAAAWLRGGAGAVSNSAAAESLLSQKSNSGLWWSSGVGAGVRTEFSGTSWSLNLGGTAAADIDKEEMFRCCENFLDRIQ